MTFMHGKNTPAVIKKGRDPWRTALEEKQDINKILEKIS
jgi:hypothetical protein